MEGEREAEAGNEEKSRKMGGKLELFFFTSVPAPTLELLGVRGGEGGQEGLQEVGEMLQHQSQLVQEGRGRPVH